jgi:hypothetical protein
MAFEAPVFLYSVHVATQQTIIISAERKLCVTFNISPFWYSWTFLMSLDVSCVQPNWTKNMGFYIKYLCYFCHEHKVTICTSCK